jgi:hypothetical protein
MTSSVVIRDHDVIFSYLKRFAELRVVQWPKTVSRPQSRSIARSAHVHRIPIAPLSVSVTEKKKKRREKQIRKRELKHVGNARDENEKRIGWMMTS